MIRGETYFNGRVKYIDFKDFGVSKNLTWIHASEVSSKELKDISEKIKIPLFQLKHVLDPREKPRLTGRDNYCLIIFRAIATDKISKRSTFPVEFIVTKNYVVTLTAEKSVALDSVFGELDATHWKDVGKEGFGPIVFRILLKLLRDYEKYLEDADDVIDALEDIAVEARDKDLHSLVHLKRKMLFLRRSLVANKDMLSDINTSNSKYVKPNESYRELYTEYAQVVSTEELIKERITGVMEMFLSSASNNLNKVMKSFTVIASILLLPMLISSVYGMNLILPLADHKYGFLIMGGIMILSIIVMLIFFSLKKWL